MGPGDMGIAPWWEAAARKLHASADKEKVYTEQNQTPLRSMENGSVIQFG